MGWSLDPPGLTIIMIIKTAMVVICLSDTELRALISIVRF